MLQKYLLSEESGVQIIARKKMNSPLKKMGKMIFRYFTEEELCQMINMPLKDACHHQSFGKWKLVCNNIALYATGLPKMKTGPSVSVRMWGGEGTQHWET